MGSSFYCELRLTSLNQDVWRGRCCSCLRQWLRHVQGRLRRRRRPQGRLPLHRWTSPPPGSHGGAPCDREDLEGEVPRLPACHHVRLAARYNVSPNFCREKNQQSSQVFNKILKERFF